MGGHWQRWDGVRAPISTGRWRLRTRISSIKRRGWRMLDERLYRSLYRIRRVEEEIARVYPTDKITSPVHLAIGQEAISVAVCEALEPEDIVFGTYRSHAYFLAKG